MRSSHITGLYLLDSLDKLLVSVEVTCTPGWGQDSTCGDRSLCYCLHGLLCRNGLMSKLS